MRCNVVAVCAVLTHEPVSSKEQTRAPWIVAQKLLLDKFLKLLEGARLSDNLRGRALQLGIHSEMSPQEMGAEEVLDLLRTGLQRRWGSGDSSSAPAGDSESAARSIHPDAVIEFIVKPATREDCHGDAASWL